MQPLPLPPAAPRLGALYGTYLGHVISVDDQEDLARVQVRLVSTPEDTGDADATLWARVAVPFAGGGRGAFLLPDVGDEVALVFVNGDPRQPLIVGGLWSGSAPPPETLGGSKRRVDRYALVGARGSRIAIVEEQDGQATISLSTPGGQSVTITQTDGGKVVLETASNKVTLDTKGVTVETPLTVKVSASSVQVSAAQVQVDAAMSTFAGIVKCDVLQATTVVAATYTPGAGNVW
ncbi:phage baseplate assembly protein V [Archangium lansingense]|uniref:phage baseplate assembly protein V n=1 Tax=Archangium lansingense TaxID=2995310 RepID=UPI003B813259